MHNLLTLLLEKGQTGYLSLERWIEFPMETALLLQLLPIIRKHKETYSETFEEMKNKSSVKGGFGVVSLVEGAHQGYKRITNASVCMPRYEADTLFTEIAKMFDPVQEIGSHRRPEFREVIYVRGFGPGAERWGGRVRD